MSDEGVENVRAAFDQAEDVPPMDRDNGAGDQDPAPRTPFEDNGLPPIEDMDPEIFRQCSFFALNDHGNGQRFRLHFGDDVMFVPRVGWHNWTGKFWELDRDQLKVRGKAQALTELIKAEIEYLEIPDWEQSLLDEKPTLLERRFELVEIPAKDLSDTQKRELSTNREKLDHIAQIEARMTKRRSTHRSFATSAGNTSRIDNACKEGGVQLAVPFEDLDAPELDINTEAGVLRFAVTETKGQSGDQIKVADMKLLPHSRDMLLTKIMPVEADRNATCEGFDKFLERVQPDREMREFLKRWFGLSMTGIKVPAFCFFYGSGANGKSVIVDLMARIMGNYSATARIESLTGQNRRGGGEATPDLVPLMNARSVRTSEPEQGQQLQEGLIKALTGGEPMQVRALQSDFVEVYPFFKLVMSGNHKPEIRGGDDGIWRRVLLTPFDVQIPEDERDLDLVDKLYDERAGILNWMIEGLLDYLEGGLAPPAQVVDATKEYRDESDPVGAFLTSCCITTGEDRDSITSKALGEAFNYHMLERGHNQWKPTTISRQLSAKSKTWKHPTSGVGYEHRKASIIRYDGIKFVEPFGTRFENAPRDSAGRILGVGVAEDETSSHSQENTEI